MGLVTQRHSRRDSFVKTFFVGGAMFSFFLVQMKEKISMSSTIVKS